jgi:hypothetical protein
MTNEERAMLATESEQFTVDDMVEIRPKLYREPARPRRPAGPVAVRGATAGMGMLSPVGPTVGPARCPLIRR